jgi:hypothetical protein
MEYPPPVLAYLKRMMMQVKLRILNPTTEL